jgi:hypothetical protein
MSELLLDMRKILMEFYQDMSTITDKSPILIGNTNCPNCNCNLGEILSLPYIKVCWKCKKKWILKEIKMGE